MKNQLRDIRRSKGLTQKQVAELLNITEGGYSHLENGRRKISDETLVRLSSIFNCTVDDILGAPCSRDITKKEALSLDDQTRAISNQLINHLSTDEMLSFQSLMRSFSQISSEGKKRLAEDADTLLRSGKYAKFGKFTFSKEDSPLQAS